MDVLTLWVEIRARRKKKEREGEKEVKTYWLLLLTKVTEQEQWLLGTACGKGSGESGAAWPYGRYCVQLTALLPRQEDS